MTPRRRVSRKLSPNLRSQRLNMLVRYMLRNDAVTLGVESDRSDRELVECIVCATGRWSFGYPFSFTMRNTVLFLYDTVQAP